MKLSYGSCAAHKVLADSAQLDCFSVSRCSLLSLISFTGANKQGKGCLCCCVESVHDKSRTGLLSSVLIFFLEAMCIAN